MQRSTGPRRCLTMQEGSQGLVHSQAPPPPPPPPLRRALGGLPCACRPLGSRCCRRRGVPNAPPTQRPPDRPWTVVPFSWRPARGPHRPLSGAAAHAYAYAYVLRSTHRELCCPHTHDTASLVRPTRERRAAESWPGTSPPAPGNAARRRPYPPLAGQSCLGTSLQQAPSVMHERVTLAPAAEGDVRYPFGQSCGRACRSPQARYGRAVGGDRQDDWTRPCSGSGSQPLR
jgi:hypothetical protein